jgi:predicted ATP-dependent serine protease
MKKRNKHTHRKVRKNTINKNAGKADNALMDFGFLETDFQNADSVEIPDVYNRRFKTGIAQLDQVWGEGLLPGSSFTITGEAGAGKTTLMLQLLESLAVNYGKRVAYATGEESQVQLAFTAKRMGLKHVLIAHRTDIDKLRDDVAKLKLDVLIVDSFQAMKTELYNKPTQAEKYIINQIVNTAKANETVIGVVMHLTKGGKLKGNSLVPHAVDMNIKLYKGDPEMFGTDQARVMEVGKNRFGGTGDAVFYMTPKGFDLDTDVNKIVEIRAKIAAGNKSTGSRKNNAAKEVEQNQILDAARNGARGVTVADATKITGNFYRGRNMLKEMEALGKLIKIGRGDSAYYIVANEITPSL